MSKNISENSLQVAKTRFFMEGEDWESCTRRVAETIATAEQRDRKKYIEEFHEIIYNQDFIP